MEGGVNLMENLFNLDIAITAKSLFDIALGGFIISSGLSFFIGKEWLRASSLVYLIFMFQILLFAWVGK